MSYREVVIVKWLHKRKSRGAISGHRVIICFESIVHPGDASAQEELYRPRSGTSAAGFQDEDKEIVQDSSVHTHAHTRTHAPTHTDARTHARTHTHRARFLKSSLCHRTHTEKERKGKGGHVGVGLRWGLYPQPTSSASDRSAL